MSVYVRTIQRAKQKGRLEYFKLTLPPELIIPHIDAGRTEVAIRKHLDGLLVMPMTPEQVADMKAGK